ncbi:Protein ENHANCED DISEASE RESISTANCE 2-like [Zea mays]|uniref:Protein ENHANCED DISEASE RESISTANCE 2-like n=1 Tax=Zea mays TaxID=4577 RepID=A0A3L6EJ40_MAIZE|nr:hypothetical protein Zm00014a_009936 [Zea mays]PWZ20967.1 Protein ENHANCED DISEASE RESISTANCE 2-like [Zea mays]
MLGSSASRRESKTSNLFWAAAMAFRDAANKTTAIEPAKAVPNNMLDATKPAEPTTTVSNAAAVRHEGWMVRYGRRKIGTSFFHTRYFLLHSKLLAYYKKKPKDNMVPLKSLLIDGNCRVEDRGLTTYHGQMIYVLCIYNKKEKEHQITMGAYDIEDAMTWKKKIELIIDLQQDSITAKNRRAFASVDFDRELGGQFLFSDHDNTAEDDNERSTLTHRTTIGNGPPDSIHDWTKESDIGLRIFEELLEVDYLARSCSRAMKAVGVAEATCEAIFGLVMSMDVTRYEWDCSFRHGSLVEEVDGHTAILYHRLQLHWCPMLVWPRDLCYARYWRRNDDGSYVVLFRSIEHPNCGRQRGFVRAFIESNFLSAHIKPSSTLEKTQTHLTMITSTQIPAASYLMELAAIDWFKDTKRMDNVARQKGCVAQVAAEKGMHTFIVNIQIPGSTQYSLVMYFVTNTLKKGSLLQRFFDGDDEFCNSRLKLIPSVPKVDVDIGSSAVANGVLGLVFGVVTTLVVDMAFLIQANTYEELPEQVIGAARLAHVEPATAVVPDLSNTSNDSSNSNDDNSNNNIGSSEDDVSKKTN